MEGDSVAWFFADSDIVVCPYNENHKVRRNRIQYHLVKCAQKHPEVKLEVCPFNATHRVSKKGLASHIAQCPHRELELLSPINFQKPPSTSSAVRVSSEDWDDEYPPTEQKSGASFISKDEHTEKSERTCNSETISKQSNGIDNEESSVPYPVESLFPEPTQQDMSGVYCLRLPKSVPWYLRDTDLARRLGIK